MKNILINFFVNILLHLCDGWSVSASEVKDIMIEYPEELKNKTMMNVSFQWINETRGINKAFRASMRKEPHHPAD